MLTPTQYAEAAVNYTHAVLGETPSNHVRQQVLTQGQSTVCAQRVRAAYDPLLDSDRLMNVRRMASAARRGRCGNCEEYAAVAYVKLLDANCPYALEFAGYEAPGDHAFVIIGRPRNSDVRRPESWGARAVVADAWGGVVVNGGSYWNEMPAWPNQVCAPRISLRYEIMGDFPVQSQNTATG